MSIFNKFLKSNRVLKPMGKDPLLEYNTYQKIYDAPPKIKALLTNKFFDEIQDAPYVDTCEFSKNYSMEFRAVYVIAVLAKLKGIAEEANFNIHDDYWKNISIDNQIDYVLFNNSVVSFCNFINSQNEHGQFCQNIAFVLMGMGKNHNIKHFINTLSEHLSYSINDIQMQSTCWLPSIHYSVFSNLFEADFEMEAYKVLGLCFGLPDCFKYYKELFEIHMASLKNENSE